MRTEKLQSKMKQLGIEALLISEASMIEYLIGTRFNVAERFLGLVITHHDVVLYLNRLFPYENTELTICRFDDTDNIIHTLARSLTCAKLGVDHHLASGFLLKLMRYRPDISFYIGSDIADSVRCVKDETEREAMRQASKLNDLAMSEVRVMLKLGMSEVEAALKIKQIFATLTEEGVSFDPIVAFGDHTSDPHAEPSERTLSYGDAIIVDMGCRFHGFCSDMTRTFFMGENPMKEIYDTVVQANLAAEAIIRPGIKLSEVDSAARNVIIAAGYGPLFIHRTGHGIGMEVHEPYDVSQTSEKVIEEGMCFSIEPGIYLNGVGGVRVEDLVLVTGNGVEVLNSFSKTSEVIECLK